MSIDANDPKLTAYALNELDAAEKAGVERFLESSDEGRNAVDEIRRAAEFLGDGLADESTAGLSDGQRKAVESRVRRGKRLIWVPISAVASIVLLIGFAWPASSRSREVSKSAESERVLRLNAELSTASEERLRPREAGILSNASGQVDLHMLVRDGVGGPTGADVALEFVTRSSGHEFQLAVPDGAFADTPDWDSPDTNSSESYEHQVDNPFHSVQQRPLSTFSIDVDTASYANVRRFLNGGGLPPKDAVRIEEMINYFSYDYPPPTGEHPFSVHVEVAGCPWSPGHRLMRVGLKGRVVEYDDRPQCNLVFLVDVSGSMQPANKLPLLKRALGMLAGELEDTDRVAIVVYAGSSGLVLPSTTCNNEDTIRYALNNLSAGGSTNGGAGIQLAYDVADEHFIEGGVNRVVLATDGDFNVGVTDRDDLIRLIEEQARGGVFLSVLGFGMGNLKDATLEQLADKGNGNYAYIDSLNEAEKVLVDQVGGTLVTIAKDVKIQIEFNPVEVGAYRLIGYENRILADRDFNDDAKDAGEIGAGHTVTALYEIIPADGAFEAQPADVVGVDTLRYQSGVRPSTAAHSGELLALKLRYKRPDEDVSRLLAQTVFDEGRSLAETSTDFRFAAAVASFGMLMRDSPYKGTWTYDAVLELAEAGLGIDTHGYREEFLALVEKAKALSMR